MTSLLLALTLAGWSAEVPLGPLGDVVPASGQHRDPVATGWGSDFLVAWTDGRFGDTQVVMTTLVQADGGTPRPFGELAGPWGSTGPALASSTTTAALVFESEGAVFLRVMADSGTWSRPVLVGGGRCPSVALNTNGGVVVFEEEQIHAVRFSPDGTLRDATPVALSSGPPLPWRTCARPAAMPDIGGYLITWRDGAGALMQMTLPIMGAAPAPSTLATGVAVGELEAVVVGGRPFITAGWDAGGAGGLSEFVGYEVGPLPSAFPVLAADTWWGLDITPCTEGLCLLSRRVNGVDRELRGGWMPLDGGAITFRPPVVTETNDWDLASTAPGDTLLLVNATIGQVRARVSDALFTPVSGELQLTVMPAGHEVPVIAFHDGVGLVVWVEPTSNRRVVKARRFDATLTPIDAQPFIVSDVGDWSERAEVLEFGAGWVLAIQGAGQASIVTVSAAGVVGTERAVPFTQVAELGFARAGDDLLLSMRRFGTQWDPVLHTFHPDGGMSTVECQATAAKEHHTDVEVTGTGQRLVVWEDVDTVGTADGVIMGMRFDTAGQQLDSAAFRISGVETAIEPALASDGDAGFFVVWRDWSHLYARHLVGTTSGRVVALTSGDGLEAQHRLIASGPGGALVVYANTRDGGVFSRELTLDATGLTVGPAQSIASTGFNAWPVAAMTEHAVWFAHSRAVTTTNTLEGLVSRFEREAAGAVCTAGWQCSSSRCDAGTCEAALVTPEVDGGVSADDGGTSNGRPRAGVLTVGWACSTRPGLWPLAWAFLLLRRRRLKK